MEKNKEEKSYKIFSGTFSLLIGLWLVIPAIVSFNFSPNSIDFWLNFISILFGGIAIISGLVSFKSTKKNNTNNLKS